MSVILSFSQWESCSSGFESQQLAFRGYFRYILWPTAYQNSHWLEAFWKALQQIQRQVFWVVSFIFLLLKKNILTYLQVNYSFSFYMTPSLLSFCSKVDSFAFDKRDSYDKSLRTNYEIVNFSISAFVLHHQSNLKYTWIYYILCVLSFEKALQR